MQNQINLLLFFCTKNVIIIWYDTYLFFDIKDCYIFVNKMMVIFKKRLKRNRRSIDEKNTNSTF